MNKEIEKILDNEVKFKFNTWKVASKHLGYKHNSAKLFFDNNFDRLNEKLNMLGLELSIKKL